MAVEAYERKRLWQEVMRNHAENFWVISLVAQATAIGVVSNDCGNVSERGVSSWVAMTPGYLNPETFYSKSARALTTFDVRR